MIPQLRAGLRRRAKRLPPERRAEAERFAASLLQSAEAFCEHLLALLSDPSAGRDLRASACWLLSELGDRRAIPLLLALVRDRQTDWELRTEAVQALGRGRSKRAVPPLVAILLDPAEREILRQVAAHALGQLDDPRARDALLRLARDQAESPGVRGDAIEALSFYGDQRPVPVLLELLHDPSPEVRFWSVFALGEVAGPDVLPELERLAATDEAVVPDWWSVQREARDAIGRIQARAGPSETIE